MAAGILKRYEDGAWLTPGLIAFASAIGLAVTVGNFAFLLATATGTVDVLGRPIGTDFTSFWSAGRLALDGLAPQAYDWPTLRDAQVRLHGVELFYPWSYPPVFLAVAAGLALLPYLPAVIVWQAATLLLALRAFWMALPSRLALFAALGCPIVFVCLGHGQTGFLTAALLLGGVLALPRREALAGVLFGLLVYKPQFGLLIPLVLAVGGYWRAIATAGVTAIAAIGLTLALWGWPVWQAFLSSIQSTQAIVLDGGGAGFEKFQSAFAWVRLCGGPVTAAYALQTLVTLLVAVGCAWIWRQQVSMRLKGAALLVGALLSTPYVLDYSLVVLGMAIALLVAHGLEEGFAPWEKTVLALAWLAPSGGRAVVKLVPLPIGFLLLVGVFAFVVGHVRAERVPKTARLAVRIPSAARA